MKNSGLKSIVINTAYLSVARLVTIIARVIYILVIANLLGPEIYGLFNYGLTWYLIFVPLAVLGVDLILIKEIGSQSRRADEWLRASLGLRSFSNVFIAVLSFALGWFLEESETVRYLLFVFSFALLGRGLSNWAYAVFKGYEKSHFVLIQEVIFRLLEVFVGILLLKLGFGVLALAMVHAIVWLIQGFSGLFLIRRYLRPGLTPSWNKKTIVTLLQQGFFFLIAAFMLSWLMQGATVIYRHMVGFEAILGHLVLALQVFIIVGSVIAELSFAAIPVLSRSVIREDGKTGLFIEVVLKIGWLLSGVLFILTLEMAPIMIPLLFGKGYEPVIDFLPWSVILVGPFFWVNSLRSVLTAHNKYSVVASSTVLGAVLFTVAFLPMINIFGVKGIFYSIGIGLLAVFVVQIISLIKVDKINIKEAFVFPAFVVFILLVTYYSLHTYSSLLALLMSMLTLIFSSLLFGLIPSSILSKIKRN